MARIPLAPLLYDFPAEALARSPSLGFTHPLTMVPKYVHVSDAGIEPGYKDEHPLSLAASLHTQSSNFYPGQHDHSAVEAGEGSNTYSSARSMFLDSPTLASWGRCTGPAG